MFNEICNKTFNETFNKMLIIRLDIYYCFSKNLLRAPTKASVVVLAFWKNCYKRIHVRTLSCKSRQGRFKHFSVLIVLFFLSFPLLRFLPCRSCFPLACCSSIIAAFNAFIGTRFVCITFLQHTPRFLDILKGNNVAATQNFINFIVMS